MNQHEKSIALCMAMDWEATWSSGTGKVLLDKNFAILSYEQSDGLPNLYDSYRFPLMWKAIEWITGRPDQLELAKPSAEVSSFPVATHFAYWWKDAELWAYEQSEFQRTVLDKIFGLAVAAGIIIIEIVGGEDA